MMLTAEEMLAMDSKPPRIELAEDNCEYEKPIALKKIHPIVRFRKE